MLVTQTTLPKRSAAATFDTPSLTNTDPSPSIATRPAYPLPVSEAPMTNPLSPMALTAVTNSSCPLILSSVYVEGLALKVSGLGFRAVP